jgi:RHS repeat-associated protein
MSAITVDGNNHIYGSGFSYDPSGNTLIDGSNTYTWDGESQLKTAAGVTYNYDGDGRRASKVGSKIYWYGSGGEILAETDDLGRTINEYVYFGGKRVAQIPATGAALYYAEDMLGSSRVMADASGNVCYDADFTPFGGERSYTSTCAQNYKFEGKERDTETGNDDFGARYYSWRLGRWLSSDWSSVPVAVPYANLTNPQTLNLYSMVGDDPESFADLDGHKPCHSRDGMSCDQSGTVDDGGQSSPDYVPASYLAQVQEGHNELVRLAQNNTVTVTVDQVKSANPYGHAVVQIDGGQKVGLVPDSDKAVAKAVAKEAASAAATGVVTPSPVPGHVEPLAASRTKDIKDTAVLHVTPEQAKQMQAFIQQSMKNLHSYDPGFNNCANFVEDVLRSGGVRAPYDMTPGGLVGDLKQNPNPQ